LISLQKPLPFKQRVQGSSPCAPTNLFKGLGGFFKSGLKCFGTCFGTFTAFVFPRCREFSQLLKTPCPPPNFNSSPFNVITAELNPNMFSSLCSWTYNLGTGALQRSSLRRLYINEGRYEAAANEMLKWVFCNGRRLRGLVLRRTDERELFLT